jgi:C-terminal processing protease CtpA/Prc
MSIDMDMVGGRADNIIVTNVVPGGPAETKYSLARGDAITHVGPLRVRDQGWDADTAMDFLTDAYQRNNELIIRRSGEQLTLSPGRLGSATGDQPAPAAPETDAGNPLQRQLDSIRVPTH